MERDELRLAASNGKDRRSKRGGPLTRAAIINVAVKLFNVEGYCNTSVREVAGEVGITDAAIYYYFQSKDDLLLTMVLEGRYPQGGRCPRDRLIIAQALEARRKLQADSQTPLNPPQVFR